MSNHDLFILFLLMSRLPIYAYVIHKAYTYRRDILLVSSNWLGLMAVAGMCGAFANAYGNKIIANVTGTLFAICLFMLAYTAKQLKVRKRGK